MHEGSGRPINDIEKGRALELFVFPLPRMVFYPGTTKPLNIFERRYIQMVKNAIASQTPIALAFAESEQLSEGTSLGVRRIAGVGRPIILDIRADETMLIILEAMGKARLGKRLHSWQSYVTCEAEWVEEQNVLARENVFILKRLNKEFVRWLEANVGDREQLTMFLSQLKAPYEKINYLCSLMIHDPEMQQRLLETDDINDRLRVAGLVFDRERTESLHV